METSDTVDDVHYNIDILDFAFFGYQDGLFPTLESRT